MKNLKFNFSFYKYLVTKNMLDGKPIWYLHKIVFPFIYKKIDENDASSFFYQTMYLDGK